jgi:ribonuclease R
MTKMKKLEDQATFSDLKNVIRGLMNDPDFKKLSHKQIIKRLGVRDKKTKNIIFTILREAGKAPAKAETKGGRPSSDREVIGTVDFVNPRFGYIVCEGDTEDIKVKSDNMAFAFHGDTVRVQLLRTRGGRDNRPEGKVVEIIKRSRKEFVGRVEISGRHTFVIPDYKKMYYDIFIDPSHLKKAQAEHDDKVVVQIIQWPTQNKNPEGKIMQVLGKSGEHEAEIHSIMAEFGLPFRFPEQILRQAEEIDGEISPSEIARRKDFRNTLTFTIDPADAKDFDDAVSMRKLGNGYYEIGVHIADVTHYVQTNSQLENEAQERATSVYLVDRTIPMLPERLSNELCSLRPNEDKLTFSAVFEMDDNAHIKKEWFGKTIIHSDRRFTYEEAQERIEQKTGDYFAELATLNELALKLRLERFMRGAINFETTEVKFDLDATGKPIGLRVKERKDAHKLIEEFMLLANKKVAERVYGMKQGKSKNTFVYRTHDYPDPEKLSAFSVFAKKFGHTLHLDEAAISRSLNNLIEDIEGKPEQNVLQTLAIRSMAKAKYTTEGKGHFGLAFQHYTHFTSPIRRYPDMMVHRLLQHYLTGGETMTAAPYEKKCQHSSEMEKVAADAERASIKYKQVEYMETMIGREFSGIVSGVTEWGVFVEITETKCEGMVRMVDLDDDFYIFEPEHFRIIGRQYKKTITLGDDIKVKVVKTDINRRTIDLELIKSIR